MVISTSRHDAMYKDYEKKTLEDAERQKQKAKSEADARLREAYITRAQNQNRLNTNMKQMGIRGGATETANLNLMAGYQNERNAIGSQARGTMQHIDDTARSNIFSYKQANDAAKNAYIEQREAENRQVDRAELERNRDILNKLYTNKYARYYSEDDLRKALNKAKTNNEKAIIDARIAYLRQHKKGY